MRLANTVINFHVIKDSDWMENIIKLLQKYYHFVGLEDLEKFYYQNQILENACHLTVDDGDVSVYTHLLPLVKKYKIPISIYVSPLSIKTGKNFWFQEIKDFKTPDFFEFICLNKRIKLEFLGTYQVSAFLKSLQIGEIEKLIADYKKARGIPKKERSSINLDQLLELKDTGLVKIGAHTLNHPILKNENFENAEKEIKGSVEELSDMLHEKVRFFAYPNGIPQLDFSQREVKILESIGVKLAFSTENKRFTVDNDPLSIPRTGISKGNNSYILSKMFLGKRWDTLKDFFNSNKELGLRKRLINLSNINT
jgi:peptidoglycan/xylan/chitin deacetylase (PgdA/CDA1 family)